MVCLENDASCGKFFYSCSIGAPELRGKILSSITKKGEFAAWTESWKSTVLLME
jgi:hypothetical protein